uniref:Uncharacterized protein n=1 Tax=Sulcionema specki TaxID=2016126 RepID=A0A6G5ZV73_9EUGL|nr:hypothetical protein [Sulcionema specki]
MPTLHSSVVVLLLVCCDILSIRYITTIHMVLLSTMGYGRNTCTYSSFFFFFVIRIGIGIPCRPSGIYTSIGVVQPISVVLSAYHHLGCGIHRSLTGMHLIDDTLQVVSAYQISIVLSLLTSHIVIHSTCFFF